MNLHFFPFFLFLISAAPNIRYKITGGNIGNVFGIKNSSGEIYVARSLDYETLKKVSRRSRRRQKILFTTLQYIFTTSSDHYIEHYHLLKQKNEKEKKEKILFSVSIL